MTSAINGSLDQNKELLNRLMILEKFIELKTNECAYYRSKVHLMQMNSLNSQQLKRTSSNENQSLSIDNKQQSNSLPSSSQQKLIFKNLNISHRKRKSKHLRCSSYKKRHQRKYHAHNQNYFEEHYSPRKVLIDNPPFHVSCRNKNARQAVLHDKTIQCNDQDFFPLKPLSKAPSIVIIIRLPDHFIKSLIEKQKTGHTNPKLKVHLSSELFHRLFHMNSNQFTIDSQYGKIAARIHNVKAEIKHHDRKTCSTFSYKHRRKKKHLHKSTSSDSPGEFYSKTSSSTHETQSIKTIPSTDQTNNSISMQTNKIKRNKIN